MIKYINEDPVFDPFISKCIQSLFLKDTNALINIVWVEELEHNQAGNCTGDTQEVEICISKNYRFECGDKGAYCQQEIASTLAHELIHARQFILGDINNEDYYYKGLNYKSVKYEETPWEVEAYSLELVLVDSFWLHSTEIQQDKELKDSKIG